MDETLEFNNSNNKAILTKDKYNNLFIRIKSFIETIKFVLEISKIKNTNIHSHFIHNIKPTFDKIKNELKEWKEKYELNDAAIEVIAQLEKINYEPSKQDTHISLLNLIPLINFVTEFEYVMDDTDVLIRSRAERAFEHLNRVIAVDYEVRKKWETAFNSKETEKLNVKNLALYIYYIMIYGYLKQTGVGLKLI